MLGRRHSVSQVTTVQALLCKSRVHLRINDGSKDLASACVIKEDLVLAQCWEVGSNLLHVHGGMSVYCLGRCRRRLTLIHVNKHSSR